MEILDAMGIVERFLHGGVRNDGYIFNFLGHEEKPRLDYTRLPTRFPFVCMFNQNETEKNLRDHLEQDLGLAIEWNAELTNIVQPAQGELDVTIAHKSATTTREEKISLLG